MENKFKKIMTVLMAVGFLAVGPVAYAESQGTDAVADPGMQQLGSGDEGSGSRSGFHHRGGPQELFKELNLTPEQKEKLRTQREGKRENMRALQEQMKTKMQALHEAISKPGITRADVNVLVSEVNAIKGQMFAQKIDGVFAMKEVLTPEQFAKMQAKHQDWMQKKHEGWKKRQKGSGNAQPESEKE